MIHSPRVLFLDEPTIGLDVSAKYALRKFIKEINRVRKTTCRNAGFQNLVRT